MSLPPELQDTPPERPDISFARSEILARSIEIRVPTFTADDETGFKVSQLEDWTLGTAAVAGGLAAERLQAHEDLANALEVWDQIEGVGTRGKTQADLRKAKALVRPDLDLTIRHRKWLIERLSEEIDRLEREYAKVSRAYTMISGG